MDAVVSPTLLRCASVGDILSPALIERQARRIDATAFVIPGAAGLDGYLGRLEGSDDDFRAWDGRIVVLEANGEPMHRVLIADRYGQVYAAIDAADASGLPDAAALEEWFRFLATACPECGVLDDPIGRGWVP